MDLRSIANSVSSTVNDNTRVQVLRSTGYTVGAGRKQVPQYATPVVGYAQVQALDGDDLRQIDGLNLQGAIRALYLRGNLHGVLRPDGDGGDIVQMLQGSTVTETWLVVKVLETWANWTKVAIRRQDNA